MDPLMVGHLYAAATQLLPHRILQKLTIWRPARVRNSTFRIPVLGGLQIEPQYFRSTWKSRVIERLANPKGELFLDVGSNRGQTLLDLRAAHPTAAYVGFEPNPASVCYITTLIRINRWQNTEVIAVGLAAEAGVSRLFLRSGKPTDDCGTLIEDFPPGAVREAICVPVFPLDMIRPLLPPQRIGFLKIDVERAEADVLRGMRKVMEEERPSILCEVLHAKPHQSLPVARGRTAEVLKILVQSGYVVCQLLKTDDLTSIQTVTELEEFPSKYLTSENKEECDYLFLPAENKESLIDRVLNDRK
jgi:FkbM family methyltransferase